MPITEMTKERRSFRCTVTGEPVIERPYSGGLILLDAVEITYQRDLENAWHLRKIKVEGSRPKKDGKPSQVRVDETWYGKPGDARAFSDDVTTLPSWLLEYADQHKPTGSLSLVSGAIDLDAGN